MNRSEHYRMTYLWMICLVAAMGGLLFGYDWVVIGAPSHSSNGTSI